MYCDLARRRCAISSCSELRTAPLIRVASKPPSARFSTSLRLPSRATGQKAMSTASVSVNTPSARSTTASSHPPHDAHQYRAIFGLSGMDQFLRFCHFCFWNEVKLQRAKFADLADHFTNDITNTIRFRRRNPFQSDPLLFNPHLDEHPAQQPEPAKCLVIAFAVVTIAGMAPADQDTVSPVRKCIQNELRIHPAGTHQADDARIRRILHSGTARQIGRQVRTPVAEERYDPGLKHRCGIFLTVRHGAALLLSRQTPLRLRKSSG